MERLDYWLWLAGTMPATQLASAAARRVRATARARWRDPEGTTQPSVHERAERWRGPRSARGPLEPNERVQARELIAQHLPGLPGDACRAADRILAGDLWLFGRWRGHERGELIPGIAAIDWAREPLHGGRFSAVPSRTIDLGATGLDVRATWEAGRLAHVSWLAEAHVVCGLPGTETSLGAGNKGLYARAAVLQLRDFAATQPVGTGIHWTCAMEVALRSLHLTHAVLLLRDSEAFDDQALCDAVEQIRVHARFVEAHLEDGPVVPNNHLLADLAALAVTGLAWPEFPEGLRWRSWPLEAFGRELVRQTLGDGFGFEASMPYHRFATELGLVVQAFARRQGLSLADEALARLWQMADVLDGATMADGRLPAIGDNDASFALLTGPRDPLDAQPTIALASALGWPGKPHATAPEALWLGGIAGLRRAAMNDERTTDAPRSFQAGGLVTLSTPDGRSVSLWAGEHGQRGLGGHAHNDKLAAEVCVAGRRVTIDPGSPTYLADPLERDRYRSTRAHPTVEIDDLEQSSVAQARAFFLPSGGRARVVERRLDQATAEYLRKDVEAGPSVVHVRTVALPEVDRAVVVTDVLEGRGVHRAVVRWPLTTPHVRARAATASERARLAAIEASPYGLGRFDLDRVWALSDGHGTFGVIALASEAVLSCELGEAMWSPGYGERVRGARLEVVVRARLPVAVTTAFLAADVGEVNSDEE